MKNCFCVLILFLSVSAFAQLSSIDSGKVLLPNGWSLSPAGRSLPLGDLPLNIVVSPSKKYLAVTNNGQSVQSLQLIDARSEKILDTKVIAKSWYGLQFSMDEKFLYASGGNDNRILRYSIQSDSLHFEDTIVFGKAMTESISPAGFVIDEKRKLMYVVTKENNSLYIINTETKAIAKRIQLNSEAFTCLLSPNNSSLYISLWGGDKILIFNTTTQQLSDSILVGDNPNEMCLTHNGKTLFVANANDNSVSVIDIKTKKVLETLTASLYPSSPQGSTTNGLALSEDEKTLFIANADNNCLAVFDVSHPGSSMAKGFIPTGWYPTNLKVVGNRIFVTNGKGFSSMANPNGPNPIQKKQQVNYQAGDQQKKTEVQYIGGLFKGTLSIIDIPDAGQLGVYSEEVYENSPFTKEKENLKVVGSSPVKYVFYIVKENRTYDQVLGDIPEGNGDTSLVLFGNRITPNQHALANQFVLLDNFYVDGEVSADGHNWSLGAYATDYLEKTWPTSYGGRGGGYDAEGTRKIANNKNGFFWDNCSRNGVSYRTYGEFADDYKANIPVLENHFCKYYTSWDPTVRDTTRFSQWRRDFDSLLAIHQVPQFNSLRFINDHTEGVRIGRPTPYAAVADNDLAVGLFVDYLSHSSIWKESVVFILEDDAQNGPDHVDAHRSTAYIAGGFVKRSYVDHTMYSTSSMLRTMELILGLPPMSQYDAAATPMWRCFSDTANLKPFILIPSNINLADVNIAMNDLQRTSEGFDFSKEDRVPDLEFNKLLWAALKGVSCPVPNRSAFLTARKEDNE